ncbi:protein arginine methyltransferase 10 [Perkinsus chesapeaki]|uniref:Protein arginine methyltransferase 10 n=1 Tax=Perkinsus chesapeaki TaxID=330153 RepID=A0A7J6MKF3_PERCH|nr:protein arginine methyltransferase 10 [Perkinsus chesapeaki]
MAATLYFHTSTAAESSLRQEGRNSETDISRGLATVTDVLVQANTELEILEPGESSPINRGYQQSFKDLNALYAGLEYQWLAVRLRNGDQFNVDEARFTLVKGEPNTAAVQSGYCLEGHGSSQLAGPARVSDPWAESPHAATTDTVTTPAALLYGETTNGATTTRTPLTFKMGGIYRLCYSSDGSFLSGKTDTPDISIYVSGVSVDCEERDCLALRPFRCWALWNAHNPTDSCVVNYDSFTPSDFPGKATWTASFSATYDTNTGVQATYTPQSCGLSTPSEVLCDAGGSCNMTGGYVLSTDGLKSDLEVKIPRTVGWLNGSNYRAHAVAACYCPDYDATVGGKCDAPNEYIQQIGIIQIYTLKLCSPFLDDCTDAYFTAVAPAQQFTIRVDCPPGACEFNLDSRIKVVSVSDAARTDSAFDLPSWTTSPVAHGCHGASHTEMLPLPVTCYSPTNCTLHGGYRQDRKEFGIPINGTSAYVFEAGWTVHEKLNFASPKEFDVCFCHGSCDTATNWFKVGQFSLHSFRPSSGYAFIGDTVSEYAFLKYVNRNGTLTFDRWLNQSSNQMTLGLQDNGIIKLLSDNDGSITDQDCQTRTWDTNYVPALYSSTVGRYRGLQHSSFPYQMGFTNKTRYADLSETLLATKAGIMAVCYCALTVPGSYQCRDSSSWGLVLRFTIRGPTPGQRWSFATNIAIRFEYEGWGLSSTDTIRIIRASGSCTGNSGNPLNMEPTVYEGCPTKCAAVSNVVGAETNIGGIVPKFDQVNCDVHNKNCDRSLVTRIEVASDTETYLYFSAPPYLRTGDVIIITSGVMCDTIVSDNPCDEDMVAAMKGVHEFSDHATNNATLADTYFVGHTVTAVEGTLTKFSVNIGWPDAKRPYFSTGSSFGEWTALNRFITKEEIKATSEKHDLKVCWSYGGNGNYVAEAGRISFIDPFPMAGTSVSLSTTAVGARAPGVISFKTAGAAIGKLYTQSTELTQLKIIFLDTGFLEAYYSGTESPEIDDNNTSEDELEEARQYVCGKLFKELWSDDTENGFPVPKGCYYRSYDSYREFFIVFDRLNGLKPDTNYKIVMNMAGFEGQSTDEEYVRIISMVALESAPYTALEIGRPLLTRLVVPAGGVTDPHFLVPGGLSISGGDNQVRELTTGSTLGGDDSQLTLLIKGPANELSAITGGHILRIYLWPLLQWDMETEPMAVCTPVSSQHTCGTIDEVKTEAVVPNGYNNILRLSFPADMTPLFGGRAHAIKLSNLDLPTGGFFPDRLAAQITTSTDKSPSYIMSSGDYIWKKPDAGYTVGKILANDGDPKPFQSDLGNILYVKLNLGATLFAGGGAATSARLTLQLPQGYQCVQAAPAEDNLSLFDTRVPHGRGTVEKPEMWSFESNNECSFSLSGYDVIFSGSSLMARITVNNPSFPIGQASSSNRWRVKIASRGYYSQASNMYPVEGSVFTSSEPEYFYGSRSVLGKLSTAVIVPGDFALSTATTLHRHWISVWFHTQQSAGQNGYVLIHAPRHFDFGKACRVEDLDGQYYISGGEVTASRLPTVLSCEGLAEATDRPNLQGNGPSTEPSARYHQALIKNQRLLKEDSLYGFTIRIVNPLVENMNSADDNSWRIWTLNSKLQYVDGTPNTVPLIPQSPNSWKPYQNTLSTPAEPQRDGTFHISAHLSSSIPYRQSLQLSTLEIFIWRLPWSTNSTFRAALPDGWQWVIRSVEDFVACRNCTRGDPLVYHQLRNITTDWPALELPVNVSSVLSWGARRMYFNASEIYGFRAPVMVPLFPPTASARNLIIEFGYDEAEASDRPFAALLPLGTITSLGDATVSSSSGVIGKQIEVVFTVQTASTILSNTDKLVITFPEGYEMPSACLLSSSTPPSRLLAAQLETAPQTMNEWTLPHLSTTTADGSASSGTSSGATTGLALPAGVECAWDSSHHTVSLRPTTVDISPGLYQFELVRVVNPSDVREVVVDATSPCGMSSCFKLESFRGDFTLDSPTYYPAQALSMKMDAASLAPITDAQRTASGRNDRPGKENNVVLQFRLPTDKKSGDSTLLLTGPQSLVFAEDCLVGLETRPDKVFGEGQPLPRQYTNWPASAEIRSCSGGQNVARMIVSAGLEKENLYAFRVRIQSNPLEEPTNNVWTIALGGESSEPFLGFKLWSFQPAEVVPVSVAKNMLREQATQLGVPFLLVKNPVSISFTTHNRVDRDSPIRGGGAVIMLTAPSDFAFVTRTDIPRSRECDGVTLEELAGDDPETEPASEFRSSDYSCIISDPNPDTASTSFAKYHRLTMTFLSDKPLLPRRRYRLTVLVNNPDVIVDTSKGDWLLQSFRNALDVEDPAISALDETSIRGFTVSNVLSEFVVRNFDSAIGLPIVAGKTEIPALYMSVKFSARLDLGDIFLIEAPEGFEFGADGDVCRGFTWITTQGNYLPNSLPTCSGRIMHLIVDEPTAYPSGHTIEWTISTINPPETPLLIHNYWKAAHFRRSSQNAAVSVIASAVHVSWTVVPQLENCSVELTGQMLAATRTSDIEISFTAVSAADKLVVRALQPPGFDFASAVVLSSGHEILESTGNTVSLRVVIRAWERSKVRLGKVRLGEGGGMTEFEITTFLIDEKKDQKSAYKEGFKQPGLLTVPQASLSSSFNSDPLAHPVSSQWGVQLSTLDVVVEATAVLRSTMTRTALAGQVLYINAKSFAVNGEGFSVRDEINNHTLEISNLTVSDDSLWCILMDPLQAGHVYDISINVQTPVDRRRIYPELFALSAKQLIALSPETLAKMTIDSKWLLETRLLEEDIASTTTTRRLPTNTNDRYMRSPDEPESADNSWFDMVAQLDFEVVPASCLLCPRQHPPGAYIRVSLVLDPQGSKPDILYLVAPPDFTFATPDCLHQYRGTDIRGCRPTTLDLPDGTQRQAAVLLARLGGLQSSPQSLKLSVLTPKQSPNATEWYIRAIKFKNDPAPALSSIDNFVYNPEEHIEVGWSEHEGFEVRQMEDSRVLYGALPSDQYNDIKLLMAVGFTTKQTFDLAGGVVRIILPDDFNIFCDTLEVYYLPVSTSTTDKCSVTRPTGTSRPVVELRLVDLLTPRDYGFSILVNTPQVTASPNDFTIVLEDQSGNVQDAAMTIPGFTVEYGTPISASHRVTFQQDSLSSKDPEEATVAKPSPAAGSTVMLQDVVDYRVTLRFNVIKVFPTDGGVHRIRIEYPIGVIHNKVQQDNINASFGAQISGQLRTATEKVELDGTNAIVLFTKKGSQRLPVGQHSINVPVTLPDSQPDAPAFNFYHLTFCRATGNCTAGATSGVLLTFPLHGFSLGDPATDGTDANIATFSASLSLVCQVFVFAFAMIILLV